MHRQDAAATVRRLSRRVFLRRAFRLGVAAASLSTLAPLAGCGALPTLGLQTTRVPRVGYLSAGLSGPSPAYDALRQGLSELGYVEGQNLTLEPRWAEGEERLSSLAAELVGLEVDLVVASGTQGAQALREATETIPIVFISASDPIRSGLVSSLQRPGGNATGLSVLSPDLGQKRLELLKAAIPGLSRVAALWYSANSGAAAAFRAAERAAPSLGLQLQSLEVHGADDFEPVIASATAGGAGALLSISSPLALAHRTELAALVARGRLPTMYDRREFVDAGGLMSYGPNLQGLYRQAAAYVDKILKGSKPADLPVEQPAAFDFVVSQKVAQSLGLSLSESFLAQATDVIR